jgi:two-component system sensor histidine kinase UhpB
MRLFFFGLFFFLFVPLLPQAQPRVIDSLQRIVNLNHRDTTQVKTLNRLASEFTRVNMGQAKSYLLQALRLAGQLNFANGLSTTYSQLTTAYSKTGDKDSASYFLDQLKQLATAHPTVGIRANYNFTAGLFYKNQGKNKEALPYMLEALKGYSASHDKTSEAGQLLNIGNTYENLGDYRNSMKYHLQALRQFEDIHNTRGQSFCTQSVAIDFIKLRQPRQALPYLQKSLALKQELKDKRGIASAWSTMGSLYNELKDFNQALSYYAKALKTAEEMKLPYETAKCNFDIGLIYVAKNELSLASQYLASAKALAKQAGDSALSKAVDAERIGIQTTVSSKQRSEQSLLNNLTTSVEMGSKSTEMAGYQHLVDFYAANKNFEKAFYYSKKLQSARDSVTGMQVQLQIKRLEEQFKNETIQKEIDLLRKDRQVGAVELKRQKTIQYAALAFAALLLVIGFLVINRYRIVQKSKRLVEIERMRNTIARDLHDDIGSTLSSINIISKIALQHQQPETIQTNFHKIEDHSRKMMDTMSDIVWSIHPGNDTLDKTVIRMKEFAGEILEPKNINYQFHESGDLAQVKLDVNKRKNLFLIFKEAVNNAAKYSRCTAIKIDLQVSRSSLLLAVTDNGIGFDSKKVRPGNGLTNMAERATLMQGTFTIASHEGKGTQISLSADIT